MSDIIKLVGQQVADSIVAHLSPAHSTPTPSTPVVHSAPTTHGSAHNLDLSQVQLVPHRKLKEPPTFVGDVTDAVDVHGWEDLMKDYIKRANIRPEQQAEEILIHLRGRAKDVVKFGLRNSGVDMTLNPDAIYALLRKHFAAVPYSPLPLADFYTTLPRENEDAYDYWLRLNQAADVAADRLKEQGKELHCPSLEVTRMFIKNCPSKELAMTFRSKTIDKWTAVEVQDVLDEFHAGRGLRGATAATVSRMPSENVHVNKVEMLHTAAPPPDSRDSPTPRSSDLAALERVVNMLEKVLLEKSAPNYANAPRQARPRPPRIEGLNALPCATPLSRAVIVHSICAAGKLMDLHPGEDGVDPVGVPPTSDTEDFESVFESVCSSMPPIEDLSPPDQIQGHSQSITDPATPRSKEDVRRVLDKLGLPDLDLDSCAVSDLWRDKLLQIIERHESIFSRHKMDCGEASDFVHKIHLVDERPFRLPYRRVAPSHYEKLRTALNEMEERGIIRKSTSEPMRLLRSGEMSSFPPWTSPRVFTMCPLHEDHKKYTAFSSPFGLHEYNRMPQGLSNSPATFMRMMLSIFGDENFTSLLCYLDDLMVFGPTEEIALQRLEMVFSRLKNHNLKLAPKKCHFLRRSVKFLGHVVSGSGVQTDPGKVDAITQVKVSDLMDSDGVTPSQKKIRSFLGMVLYYQHFIEDCSTKARPLFKLLSEQKTVGKSRHRRMSDRKRSTQVKLSADDWTSECQTAFDTLKNDLSHSATLAHPDFERAFILAVDASFDGIGAVLSQIQPGEKVARPVAFASRTLSKSQLNYPAHRLEFLALKWAICDKFSHWLKGRHFTAWSDNNPLTYILTKPRLDACEQRWVAKLAAYDFDLKYVPGSKNTVADALSREPFVQSSIGHRLIKEPYLSLLDEVNGVVTGTVQDAFRLTTNCQAVQTAAESTGEGHSPAQPGGAIGAEEVSAILDAHCAGGISHLSGANPSLLQLPDEDPSIVIPRSQLHNLQQQDATVNRALFYVQRHRKPNAHERAAESSCVLRLLKHWERLKVCNGILYRVKRDHRMNKKIFQVVIPESLKHQVLHGVHDAAGHQGRSRTLSLASERFFWTGMGKDVVAHVKHCQRCILGKTPEPAASAPLENIRTSAPMELVCIDFWTAESGDKKTTDVLVVTDHFSKLALAFPCRNQSAKQVARCLWDKFFCIYGFPKRIHSDQGANFESRLIRDLLEMAGVHKSHTTPYHPMGNGITERFNRTLGGMIRTLSPKYKCKWPQMLQMLTFSYNCTVHETTGFAPFYLMFGRIPRLPVDVMFHHVLENVSVVSHHEFVDHLRRDLSEAAQIARQHAHDEQNRHAKIYNRKVKGSPLAVGDRVLLANRGEKGKKKVADRWDSTPFDVVSVKPEIHVYRIRDAATGKEKVVHRNMLLPVDFLSFPEPPGSQAVSGEPQSAVSCQSDRCCVVDGREAAQSRTMDWLMQSPDQVEEENGSVSSSDGISNASLVVAVDTSKSGELPNCTTEDLVQHTSPNTAAQNSVSDPVHDTSHFPTDVPIAMSDSLSPDEVELEEVVCTHPVITQTPPAFSRCGRAIKHPNRLICEMLGQRFVGNTDTHLSICV
ncbi:uncharacterized protein LOC118558239 [Fundulus heteroclitus]|uniref:uncharacterized protein LOC118558239 n=1 Tax=Fundulus heteroclitus TaxID=8078 RepID=UPI00165A2916|nr:uncharacterized protein LOC118558239 [Fundulus heteroclitus]